ncbi:MAG: hypothetical protein LBU25_07160 [Treponema sp.]|jgi:hypothetical protein|nr:hypothetical protein [Treponema sp.]
MKMNGLYYRFVPATYFDYMKGEFNLLCYKEEQMEYPKSLVLGGRYKIITISGFFNPVCRLEPGGYFIQKKVTVPPVLHRASLLIRLPLLFDPPNIPSMLLSPVYRSRKPAGWYMTGGSALSGTRSPP